MFKKPENFSWEKDWHIYKHPENVTFVPQIYYGILMHGKRPVIPCYPEFESNVNTCFDLCYREKKYKQASLCAKNLISSCSKHRNCRLEVVFTFMKFKLLKHMCITIDAKKCLVECKNKLNMITTQEMEFSIYFGIVILYEGALLKFNSAAEYELAETQFEETILNCQIFFTRQNQESIYNEGSLNGMSEQYKHIKLIECYALNYRATIYRHRKQRIEAFELLKKILSYVRTFKIKDDIIEAKARYHMGITLLEDGHTVAALKMWKNAKTTLRNLQLHEEHNKQILMNMLQEIANSYLNTGRISEAFETIKEPLKYAKTNAADDDFRVNCWILYGKILLKKVEYGESIKILAKSEIICVNRKFDVITRVMHLKGINYYNLGNASKFPSYAKKCFEEALKHFQKALEIAEYNKEKLRAVYLNISMGLTFIKQSKLRRAEECFERAIAIGKNNNDKYPVNQCQCQCRKYLKKLYSNARQLKSTSGPLYTTCKDAKYQPDTVIITQ